MYYLICFSAYFCLLLYFLYGLNKPNRNEKQSYKDTFVNKSMKAFSNSDIKSRKRRVKVLPLYQRFLYWVWFSSIIIMTVMPTIVLYLIRYNLIDILFIPENVLYFESSSLSLLLFGIGSFLCGIPILVLYSYITNRGIIKMADSLYKLGSFQEYPKKMNIIISTIFLLVGLPIIIISFYNYRYLTNDIIVIKGLFSISENKYNYPDLEYVRRKHYTDDAVDYIVVLKNSEEFYIAENSYDYNNELNKLFISRGIKLTDEYVKPLI